ncbi:MAG TPA: NAD(P)H-dependent oxidoreductase subunit E [Phycisphaerae bacterium]|nr:NAD(P)H-dependent oxidoreductase subunit E [Phycisphaerae bacterium]
MSTEMDTILDRYGGDRRHLLEVLQDLQEAEGYISEEAMAAVSENLRVPLMHVYRAASFYKAFSLTPLGKHVVTVCAGTACHVRGTPRLLDEVRGQLRIDPGETTPDGLFTLESVNCLGACALGPVVVIDGVYHDHVTPAKLRGLVDGLRIAGQEVSANA